MADKGAQRDGRQGCSSDAARHADAARRGKRAPPVEGVPGFTSCPAQVRDGVGNSAPVPGMGTTMGRPG
jgi:hypothetical protein